MILKKRLLIVVVITMMLTTVSLCGCGEKDKIEDPIGSANVEGAVVQDEELEEEPSPIETSGQVVVIEGSLSFDRSYGGRYDLLGEVHNTGETWVAEVLIIAAIYDDRDFTVGNPFAQSEIGCLAPGQKSPFTILRFPSFDDYDRYTLEVKFKTTDPQERYEGIEITKDELKTNWGRTLLEIELHDKDGQGFTGTLIVTFYNDKDEMISYEKAQVYRLRPNGFKTINVEAPERCSDYTIQIIS